MVLSMWHRRKPSVIIMGNNLWGLITVRIANYSTLPLHQSGGKTTCHVQQKCVYSGSTSVPVTLGYLVPDQKCVQVVRFSTLVEIMNVAWCATHRALYAMKTSFSGFHKCASTPVNSIQTLSCPRLERASAGQCGNSINYLPPCLIPADCACVVVGRFVKRERTTTTFETSSFSSPTNTCSLQWVCLNRAA